MEKIRKWSNDNQGFLAIIGIIVAIILAIFEVWFALIIFISTIIFFCVVWLYQKAYRFFTSKNRELKILKAEYGSGNKFIDITNQLNDLIVNNTLNIKLSNGILGYDPVPNVLKIAKIEYQLNKTIFKKKVIEGKIINLP